MIKAESLVKTFRSRSGVVEAVRGIDFEVEAGAVVALLGPNGAGKSTTLRMLTTLLEPTSGRATVGGYDVVSEAPKVRRCLGYIGQGNGAGHYHRVRDELLLQGRAYGLGWSKAGARADELLEAFQLTALARRTSGSLSGGQRRRLDIAMGLVHAPPVLFLDEPSTGLDPQNRANLWQHVFEIRERFGVTILLTTHYLEEADAMAERVLIIDHGRVIADDPPERLKADLAGDLVLVRVADPAQAPEALAVAQRLTAAHDRRAADGMVELRLPAGAEVLPAYLRELDRGGIAVRTAEVVRPTLDDVFLNLTGRSLREEAATESPPETPAATDAQQADLEVSR